MKKFILLTLISIGFSVYSQQNFNVEIAPLVIEDAPGVQSYSWGKTTDNKWVIIGGRIDGLHQRQPFAAFLAADNNTTITVIDVVTKQVWSKSLSTLSSGIYEQLQATNQNFYQRENTLYITGGYGFSAFLNDHVTYPNLTAVALDGVANAVINNASLTPFFRQITDEKLAITGGQMGYLNDTFYLCGGQLFEGRYNPMGPTFGPGFIQKYANAIKKFTIEDDGTNLQISNYSETIDSINLHRRDYNMSPQIFPDGSRGFTMFSGVFNPNDLPYLNAVDVSETGYTVNNNFNQYLSQYHSAKVPLYDSLANEMHTLFFGGMSQYTLDEAGELVQDNEVPFVKTISLVTRKADGTMQEKKLTLEMPTLLGAGAEFIPIKNVTLYIDHEIVHLNNITGRTLIGYIYGGIESSAPNIFFSNTGTQSSASGQIFEVYITSTDSATSVFDLSSLNNQLKLQVFPNPVETIINIETYLKENQNYTLTIFDTEGKKVMNIPLENKIGEQLITINIEALSAGIYSIVLENDGAKIQQKIQIK